jgi:hypothetical protein
VANTSSAAAPTNEKREMPVRTAVLGGFSIVLILTTEFRNIISARQMAFI